MTMREFFSIGWCAPHGTEDDVHRDLTWKPDTLIRTIGMSERDIERIVDHTKHKTFTPRTHYTRFIIMLAKCDVYRALRHVFTVCVGTD